MASVRHMQWNGSLLELNLFARPTTLVVSAFGTTTTSTLIDQSGILYVGETVTMNGVGYTYLGSGTAQPGINVLGATVPTGVRRDLILLQDASGKIHFVFPAGVPNALGMIALVVDVRQVGYNLGTGAPICFAEGTRILTGRGEIAVEQIMPGDRVVDHRGRTTPVLWRGSMSYGMAISRFHPVEIEAHAFGAGRPARRMLVSQQHRIAIDARALGLRSAGGRALVPAVALINGTTVRIGHSDREIRYHHLLCPRHSTCIAEGLLTETLLLGHVAIGTLTLDDRARIRDLSHGLVDFDAPLRGALCKPALPVLTAGDLRRAGYDPARGARLMSPL